MQHIENELRRTGRQALAVIAGIRKSLSNAAAVAEDQTTKTEAIKIYPEISLEEEWNRQAQNLAGLFAKELKFETHEEYIATLPKFEPQPDEYRGRLDIPVIVETRVPLRRMLELSGIVSYFDVDSIEDWEKGDFETPEAPYLTWLNDGYSNLNESVSKVRESLKADERGGNIHDGIALYLRDPQILDEYYWDLPGSQVGSDRAPSLARWRGQTRLSRYFVDAEVPFYGSVVAGKKLKFKS